MGIAGAKPNASAGRGRIDHALLGDARGFGRKQFFSEEKNQKTFVSQQVPRSRPLLKPCRGRRNKSLLLLFFRKEGSSCWLGGTVIDMP
jgi:hypothetical protein